MDVEEPFPAMIWPHAMTSAITGFPATDLLSCSVSSDECPKSALNMPLISYMHFKIMCSILLSDTAVSTALPLRNRSLLACLLRALLSTTGQNPAKTLGTEGALLYVEDTR